MHKVIIYCLLSLFSVGIHAQENNPAEFNKFLVAAQLSFRTFKYDQSLEQANKARWYNGGKSTLELHILFANNYYKKDCGATARCIVNDAFRLFPVQLGETGDKRGSFTKLISTLEDEGFIDNQIDFKDRKERAKNRNAWVEFFQQSKDDASGKYKNCPNCSGPAIETYYNNILFRFDAAAYDALCKKTNDLNDRIFFLENFPGNQYFNSVRTDVCTTIDEWASEHEKEANSLERVARKENTKGIVWSVIVAPVSLLAIIAGAKSKDSRGNMTTGGAIGLGLGIGGLIYGIGFGAPHFTEAASLNEKAQEERRIAARMRNWYNCSVN